MTTMIPLVQGSVFARDFRVLRPLSEGGMGAVYVVEQISTGKERALKVMHPQLVRDPRSRERFAQEARVGARIESDHIVEVVGAGVDEATGTPWLAMELLRGEDLASVMARRGRLPLVEVREVFRQLGHALGAAHRAGLVHRDLKPENIFLSTPRRDDVAFTLKILDFGIAKVVQETRTDSATTGALGSPFWMAPEQMGSDMIRPSTDVWALGLVAFHLLTGRFYWRAASNEGALVQALLVEIMVQPLEPASYRAAAMGCADALPPGFDAWFARCVVREPDQRFADGAQAVAAIAGWTDPAPAMAWASATMTPAGPVVTPTMAMASGSIPGGFASPYGTPSPLTRVGHTASPQKSRAPLIVGALLGVGLLGVGAVVLGSVLFRRALPHAEIGGDREPVVTPVVAPPVVTPPPPPLPPIAAPVTCTAAQHLSDGHCCTRGEEWVPTMSRCECVDLSVCGPRPAAPVAPRVREPRVAQPREPTYAPQPREPTYAPQPREPTYAPQYPPQEPYRPATPPPSPYNMQGPAQGPAGPQGGSYQGPAY